MRVIAGKYRSRRLLPVGKLPLRPTSDRLRETLFDILGPRVSGASFLDLFSGTGAVGIEALSRGAAPIFLAEHEPRACSLIRRNLDSLGISAGAVLLPMDAIAAIDHLASRKLTLDFIFLDPPYHSAPLTQKTLARLQTSSLLAPSALIILEHLRRSPLPDSCSRLALLRTVLQGDSALSFLSLPAPPTDTYPR